MYLRILVPVDLKHTEKLGKALDLAGKTAKEAGAEVLYVDVVDAVPTMSPITEGERAADELHKFAAGEAQKHGIIARSENHLVHWELVRNGLGIGVNGRVLADTRSDVRPILPDQIRFRFPVWLVAPRELKTNARVRVVFDALAAFLADPGFTSKKAKNSA